MDANSAADLNSFANASPTLDAVRTNPATQIANDYAGFPGTPTIPLIDLTTMEVLVSDCFYYTGSYQGETTWKACIDDFL